MAKLFEKFFSPAKILQLPVASEAEMYDAAISWCDSNGIGLDPEQLEQLVNTLFVTICDTTPPVAQPAPVPLTDEQINNLRQQYGVTSDGRGIKEFTYVVDFARAIEAAHGITKGHPC